MEKEILEMLEKAHQMLHTTYDGFMKHDLGLLDQVLKDEEILTRAYTTLTSSVVEPLKGKLPEKERKAILGVVEIISAIEKIGDCCVGLVERIEYKITEKLLFSETALEEYKNLYRKVDHFLSDTGEVIRMKNQNLAKNLIKGELSLNKLVDKYRANHLDRLARGICDGRASTMHLDMLGFTKEIVHHCVSMTRQILKAPE